MNKGIRQFSPPVEDFMAADSTRHHNRHYKTLILLVLSMTGGTFLLLWLAQFSPVTPLRGRTSGPAQWTEISVRAEASPDAGGFYHLRIDGDGRLFRSDAWRYQQPHPDNPSMIQILLSATRPDGRPLPAQQQTLSRVLAQLGRDHKIASERVTVRAGSTIARSDQLRLASGS